TGPNTGGMGAYSPAPIVTAAIETKAMDRIVRPALAAMAKAGAPFRGVLFAGLMIDKGEPRLLEFNVRFGDPECQVLMARIQSDILALSLAACEGKLAGERIRWKSDPAIAVVMATKGYPGAYESGSVIAGLDDAAKLPGVSVLHAATARNESGALTA